MQLAVMQGRLLPPVGNRIQAFPGEAWRDEFRLAHEAGVTSIEWIYEAETDAANPLSSDEGVADIHEVIGATGITVSSVCADWFMAHPLVHGDPEARLPWVIERAAAVGASHVVLPFVDNSALALTDVVSAAAIVRGAAGVAERFGVELHLETSLEPSVLRGLVEAAGSDAVRVTWDIGNSAAAGFDPVEELDAFGSLIGSVHVKDRALGGATVPLGTGDVDLSAVIRGLRSLSYGGTLVLQIARGESGDEVAWVRTHRDAFVRAWEDAA